MEKRLVCQWEKGMIEGNGLIKTELLGLRILAVLRETVDLIWEARGERVNVDDVPQDNPEVYRTLAKSK